MRTRPHMHWRSRKVGHITVSVNPKPRTPYTVLQVTAMVDTGTGSSQMVLKNALPGEWEIDLQKPGHGKKRMDLPCRIHGMNCVYTGRSFGVITDVTDALRAVTGNAKLAAIVPDVIMPGDFVVFKHVGEDYKIRFAGVVRAIRKAA